jgi:hypothetical protein
MDHCLHIQYVIFYQQRQSSFPMQGYHAFSCLLLTAVCTLEAGLGLGAGSRKSHRVVAGNAGTYACSIPLCPFFTCGPAGLAGQGES